MEMRLDNTKLKELRESKAWSQSQVAEASGISLRTIQRIEKTGVASPESVKCLCATFGIQIHDLSVDEDNQKELSPTFLALIRHKISNVAIKATLIAFSIAFIIAFILSM